MLCSSSEGFWREGLLAAILLSEGADILAVVVDGRSESSRIAAPAEMVNKKIVWSGGLADWTLGFAALEIFGGALLQEEQAVFTGKVSGTAKVGFRLATRLARAFQGPGAGKCSVAGASAVRYVP